MSEDKDLEPLLGAYLDGELGPEETEKVRDYLQKSPRARELVRDFQVIDEAVYRIEPPVVEDVEWDRVALGFQRELNRRSNRRRPGSIRRFPGKGILALAAAAAILIAISAFVVAPLLKPSEDGGITITEFPLEDKLDPDDVDGTLLLIEVHG